MPNRRLAAVSCLCCLILCGCQQVDLDAEREHLLETDRAFAKAALELGPAEAFNQYLAIDAMQLPNGSLPLIGRELIRRSLDANQPFLLKWQPQGAQVSQSLDIGYTWGNYEAIIELPENESISTFGKYLNIWHRDSTGQWFVKVDMSNQNPVSITPPTPLPETQ